MVDSRRLYRAENQDISILESQSGNKFAVRGTRGDIYSVDFDEPYCECPDWQKRSPEGGCKHILKVKLELGIAEPSNSGKPDDSSQDPNENLPSQNKTAYQVEPGTYVMRSDSNQDRYSTDSSDQERSKTSESVAEQDESGNNLDVIDYLEATEASEGESSTSNPKGVDEETTAVDTEGTPYVWTEREQIGDDVVCDNCNHINDNSSLKCEDCGSMLLGDDDSTDHDDSFSDHVGEPQYQVKEDVFEVWEAKVDNIVIGLYETFKAGIKLLFAISNRIAVFFGILYVCGYFAKMIGFDSFFGVAGGMVIGIFVFGYLFRHPDTAASQIAS